MKAGMATTYIAKCSLQPCATTLSSLEPVTMQRLDDQMTNFTLQPSVSMKLFLKEKKVTINSCNTSRMQPSQLHYNNKVYPHVQSKITWNNQKDKKQNEITLQLNLPSAFNFLFFFYIYALQQNCSYFTRSDHMVIDKILILLSFPTVLSLLF